LLPILNPSPSSLSFEWSPPHPRPTIWKVWWEWSPQLFEKKPPQSWASVFWSGWRCLPPRDRPFRQAEFHCQFHLPVSFPQATLEVIPEFDVVSFKRSRKQNCRSIPTIGDLLFYSWFVFPQRFHEFPPEVPFPVIVWIWFNILLTLFRVLTPFSPSSPECPLLCSAVCINTANKPFLWHWAPW